MVEESASRDKSVLCFMNHGQFDELMIISVARESRDEMWRDLSNR